MSTNQGKTVTVRMEFLDRFRSTIERDLRRGGNGPIRDALHQWGARYRSFVQHRFVRLSRGGGGGEWPPLKRSTVRARRGPRAIVGGISDRRTLRQQVVALKRSQKQQTRKVSILRDTNTLFGALDTQFTGKPGQLQKDIPMGVRVGFGGPARHPKGRATVADIASFHQRGSGHLPKREIIVSPDAATQRLMAGDMQRALERLLRS